MPSGTFVIANEMLPFSVAQAVGSVLVKPLAVSVPPVVPLKEAVTEAAPAELKLIWAGFEAGAVPFMEMYTEVSKVPVLSGTKDKLLV